MEPCSILELSSTVLKLSATVYKFFKALHNAPTEVLEYLDALGKTRKVLLDVQEYAEAHEQSTLRSVDGMRLTTLRVVLEECEVILTKQQSSLETFKTGDLVSRFQSARNRFAFVLGREALQTSTKKLIASQALLAQAITTSTGRNTVLTRNAVNSIALDVKEVRSALEDEVRATQDCLEMMSRCMRGMQEGFEMLMSSAKDTSTQNTTHLDDVANVMGTQLNVEAEQHDPGRAPCPEDDANNEAPEDDDMQSHKLQSSRDHPDCDLRRHRAHPRIESGINPVVAEVQASGAQPPGPQARLAAKIQGPMCDFQQQRLEFLSTVATRLGLGLGVDNTQPSRSRRFISVLTFYVDIISPIIPHIAYLSLPAHLLFVATLRDNTAALNDFFVGMQELGDAITTCTREAQLYHDNERISDLAAQVYIESLRVLSLCTATIKKTQVRKWERIFPKGFSERFKGHVAATRETSGKLMREVDYQHRLEMRELSYKIADINSPSKRPQSHTSAVKQ